MATYTDWMCDRCGERAWTNIKQRSKCHGTGNCWPTWEEIRKLPSPIVDALDESQWTAAPPNYFRCDWCRVEWPWDYEHVEYSDACKAHPQNGCLWARAHTPVPPATSEGQ